jgi:hypothetical protein
VLLSLVSATEELLGRNSSGSGLEIREYGLGIRHADHVAPSIRKKKKVGTNFADKRRSLGLRPRSFFFLLKTIRGKIFNDLLV